MYDMAIESSSSVANESETDAVERSQSDDEEEASEEYEDSDVVGKPTASSTASTQQSPGIKYNSGEMILEAISELENKLRTRSYRGRLVELFGELKDIRLSVAALRRRSALKVKRLRRREM